MANEETTHSAIDLGLRLPVGRQTHHLLVCTKEILTGAFFIEEAQMPTDRAKDKVKCPRCQSDHYVYLLEEALDQDTQILDFGNEDHCSVNLDMGALVAAILRASREALSPAPGPRLRLERVGASSR